MTEPGLPSVDLPAGIDQDGEVDFDGLGKAAWVTDVGKVRSRNEDRLLVKSLWGGRYALLLVADGAGGHDAGDKAAEAVVATFNADLSSDGEPGDGDPARWIRDAITDAHAQVRGLGHGQTRPPASTVVGMIVERESLCGWRFHVGDSRLYVRGPDGMVAQWTRDHNITNGLIDRGLPVTQALKIADGGRLTQVLGGGSDPEPEVLGPLALVPGQVLLLCSDGIYGHNGDREVLLPAMNPERGSVVERIAELKAAVLEGDAPDNLTAVLWQVPDDAVATRERETVTNSMRAITAEDLEKAAEEAARSPNLSTTRLGPDTGATQPRPSSPVGWIIVLLLILAGFFFLLTRTPEPQPPEPTPTAAPTTAPTPAPTVSADQPLPWPDNPEQSDRLQALVRGFDADWWSGLANDDQVSKVGLLADLVAPGSAPEVVLSYRESAESEPVEIHAGWKLPGGDGAAAAERAWQARDTILAGHPVLGAQPGIPQLLADAACSSVELRWPRGDSVSPGDAGQLGSWLAACLPPDLGGRSLLVRLGGWPSVGWRMDDLNAARYLFEKEGGAADLIALDSAENARLLELGLLAVASKQPSVAHISIEIDLRLSTQDRREGTTDAGAALAAQARAEELASLIRAAADGREVLSTGGVGDELVSDWGGEPAEELRAALSDLNRHVVVRFEAGGGEPVEEELPGEAESIEEVELPDQPDQTPSSGDEAGDETPAVGDDDDSAPTPQ